jgi:hypothetical protein
MSTSPMRMPTITLDDDAWDDLLNFIEEQRVIPRWHERIAERERDGNAALAAPAVARSAG